MFDNLTFFMSTEFINCVIIAFFNWLLVWLEFNDYTVYLGNRPVLILKITSSKKVSNQNG